MNLRVVSKMLEYIGYLYGYVKIISMLPERISKDVGSFAAALKRTRARVDLSQSFSAHHGSFLEDSQPIRLTPRRLFETFNKLAEVIPGEEGENVREGLNGNTAVALKRGAMTSLVLYSLAHSLLPREKISALFEGFTDNDVRVIRGNLTKEQLNTLAEKAIQSSKAFDGFKEKYYPKHPSTAHVKNVLTVVAGRLQNLHAKY